MARPTPVDTTPLFRDGPTLDQLATIGSVYYVEPEVREEYQRLAADPVEDFKVRKQWNDDASSMGYWDEVRRRSRVAAGLPQYDHLNKLLPVADEVVSAMGYWMHLSYKDRAKLRAANLASNALAAESHARRTLCHGCHTPGAAPDGRARVFGIEERQQLCPTCVRAAETLIAQAALVERLDDGQTRADSLRRLLGLS